MARISPVNDSDLPVPVKEAFEQHILEYRARITNMKATLAHSLPAFNVYMQWYVLYGEVEKLLGKRLASLYAYSISYATDCPLCSTFFRKIIIDSGERPENIEFTEQERKLMAFGSSIAKCQGHIADHIYNSLASHYNQGELVTLIAFAGQMIATNIFSNVIETDIDDYLSSYLPPIQSIWHHV